MTTSGVGKDEKCGRAQYLNSGTKNVHPFCMCPKDPYLAVPLVTIDCYKAAKNYNDHFLANV